MSRIDIIKDYFAPVGEISNVSFNNPAMVRYIDVTITTDTNCDSPNSINRLKRNLEILNKISILLENIPNSIKPIEWCVKNYRIKLKYDIGLNLKKFNSVCKSYIGEYASDIYLFDNGVNKVEFRIQLSIKPNMTYIELNIRGDNYEDCEFINNNGYIIEEVKERFLEFGFIFKSSKNNGNYCKPGKLHEKGEPILECEFEMTEIYDNVSKEINDKDVVYIAPLNAKERDIILMSEGMSKMLESAVKSVVYSKNIARDIFYKEKDNKTEFGYYFNWLAPGPLLVFMKRFGLTTITDLGCGMGLLLRVMRAMDKSITYNGYDNEQELLDIATSREWGEDKLSCLNQDLLTLKTKHLFSNKELLYFWEPIKDVGKAKLFIDNLCNEMYTGQYLICRHVGDVTKKVLNQTVMSF